MTSACSSFHRISFNWETGPVSHVTDKKIYTITNVQVQILGQVYTGTLCSDSQSKKIDFKIFSKKNSLMLSCEEIAKMKLSVTNTAQSSIPIILDQPLPSLEEDQPVEIQISSKEIDNTLSVHARFHIESTPSHAESASKRVKEEDSDHQEDSVPMSIEDLHLQPLTKEDIAFHECDSLQPGELTLLQVGEKNFALVMRMPHFYKKHAGQLYQTTNDKLSVAESYQTLEQLKEKGFQYRQDLNMALCLYAPATACFLCASFDWSPLSATDDSLVFNAFEQLKPEEFATIQNDQDCYEIIMRMPMDALLNPGKLCQSLIYNELSANKLTSMIQTLQSAGLTYCQRLDQRLEA